MRIHIPDPDAFEAKRQQFIVDGPDNLHIVADFDGTLSRSKVDGQKIHSTLAVIREGGYLGPAYVQESFALADQYRPMEHDSDLTLEERMGAMRTWWEEHLTLLIRHGMHKGIVDEIIAKGQVQGKRGLHELLSVTHALHIPTLIFSAGAGSIIRGFLKRKHVLYPSVHLISNIFAYDAQGRVTGYESKIIHSLNKKEVAIKDTAYVHEIRERRNVLLLGDSLGDVDMAHGMSHDAIIRIGFLNGEREKLGSFAQAYDILVLEDDDLSYVTALLREIAV